ncbi:HAD family hydrolase [candidate division KSB1 bacterium]
MANAVIFDMDGVISDTQKIHSKVESELLGRLGVIISPDEITRRFSGVQTSKFFKEIIGESGVECDIESLLKEKWEKMIDLARKDVDAIPHAFELINELSENRFKLAVASASKPDYVDAVLTNLGVKDRFQAIVSSDEVENGKPWPDVFLLAAEKISEAPENCLVIEDGISGMIAAKRANMKSVGLVPELDPKTYPADVLVLSLEELNAEKIKDM